jgi:hypothetical protein
MPDCQNAREKRLVRLRTVVLPLVRNRRSLISPVVATYVNWFAIYTVSLTQNECIAQSAKVITAKS